jgi:xanthine dehydrogenase YagT iron-sulfur-binding subunit
MKENKKQPLNPGERDEKRGISRRGFLKGAGLTTAGTVVLKTGMMAATPPGKVLDKTIGHEGKLISLNINGSAYRVRVEPRHTLAFTLREQLELTGTKVVCDRGSCSACTVWVDNKPVCSCLTLTMGVEGKKITTIEGLSNNGELHPVQEAFIEYDAAMCGYCTPGMVMSCAHLVENKSDIQLNDVKHAIRGNLCRCGTYPNVFKATLAAAEKMKNN